MSLAPAKRLLALKALPGFAKLPPEQLLILGERSEVTRCAGGEILQRAGLLPDDIHLVVDGRVEVERDGCAPWEVGARELVGGWEALTREPASYAATVAEPSVMLSFAVRSFEALVADSFGVYRSVLRELARALARARQRAGHALSYQGPPIPVPGSDARLDVAELLAVVVRTEELSSLPLDVLTAMTTSIELRTAADGETLWEAGERQSHAVLPLDATLMAGDEGDRAVPPGHLVGFDEALAGDPRSYDLRVVGAGRYLVLPRRILLDELEDHEKAARRFLRDMARRQVRYEGYALLRGGSRA